MKLRITQIAEKILPSALAEKTVPHLARIDDAIGGEGDSAVSARIAIFAFGIRILSAAIAYFSQVLLVRWMGAFEYGIFIGVWVAAVILGGIACLGFQTGIIRFISEYRTSGESDYLRGAITGSLSWAVIASTLIAAVGSAGIYYFADWFENYYLIPIYLAAICLPMLSLQEVQDGIARAHNWPGVALVPTFIFRPILILVVMLIAIWLGYPTNAPTAMIATIIAVYVASLWQFALLAVRLKNAVPRGPRKFVPVQWIAVTMPIFLIEGFYVLLTNVDILFVSHFMEPDKVAVYFAAAKTLALVHFVYFAVRAAAAHRFSVYHSSGDQKRYGEFIRETIHWTFWPSLGFAILMMIVGRYFLMLFDPSFVIDGESVIWILTIGIIARASVGPAESVLTMSGEQKACAIVYAATLLFNLILNWKLIPIYGLNGAAMATSAALVFESFALYAAARRQLDLHISIIPEWPRRDVKPSAAE